MYSCIEFINHKWVDKTDELKFVAIPEKRLRVQNHQLFKMSLARDFREII